MSKRRGLERQNRSLAKRGYDLYEYEAQIRFRLAPAWLHTAKKLSNFSKDEFLVGTSFSCERHL
jgi:hypothetical protein